MACQRNGLGVFTLGLGVLLAGTLVGTPAHAAGPAKSSADEETEASFIDPRLRNLPRKHRFRLGAQVDYMRLSAAIDEETQEVQRFHYAPLQIDFGYQARLGRYAMIRPSLAIGMNLANTTEAMPLLIHPQLYGGFQGRLVGVAVGYGFLGIPLTAKDARSEVRGGLGQPVIYRPHQVGGELSFTTRVHQKRESAPGAGELSIILRLSGVRSRTLHFEVDRTRWRAMFSFNLGWYFGDGRRRRAAAAG